MAPVLYMMTMLLDEYQIQALLKREKKKFTSREVIVKFDYPILSPLL